MLIAGIGFGVLLFVLLVGVRRYGFTFYHPFGFRSFSLNSEEDRLTPVSRERFARILIHVPTGDRFDFLTVSHQGNPSGGIFLDREDGEVMLSVDFRPCQESDRIDAFRTEMKGWGYLLIEEHPWNVGLGPELESVTLKFQAPKELAALEVMIDRALTYLEGPFEDSLYVLAGKIDLPSTRYAIRLDRRSDPLEEIP